MFNMTYKKGQWQKKYACVKHRKIFFFKLLEHTEENKTESQKNDIL